MLILLFLVLAHFGNQNHFGYPKQELSRFGNQEFPHFFITRISEFPKSSFLDLGVVADHVIFINNNVWSTVNGTFNCFNHYAAR